MKQNQSRNLVWVFENLGNPDISDSKVFSGSVLSDPISFRSVPNIGFPTFSVSCTPLQKDYVLNRKSSSEIIVPEYVYASTNFRNSDRQPKEIFGSTRPDPTRACNFGYSHTPNCGINKYMV